MDNALNLKYLSKQVEQLLADARRARIDLNKARRNLGHDKQAVEDARDAQKLVQQVAQIVQRRAHAKLAGVVTRCLQAVFGKTFEFKIAFNQKRGKTEAKLLITEDGLELEAMDECAGGVVDVAAFGLRLACLLLQRPVRRRLLVLDEPFRFVSERKEYRQRVVDLLLTLAKEMEVQIIQVTHSRELEIGKVIEL